MYDSLVESRIRRSVADPLFKSLVESRIGRSVTDPGIV